MAFNFKTAYKGRVFDTILKITKPISFLIGFVFAEKEGLQLSKLPKIKYSYLYTKSQ
jgi:hypothetical protein